MSASPAPSSRAATPGRRRGLSSILREEAPLATELAADIAFDICDALANLHASNMVHGDLGPHCVRLFWPRNGGQRDIEIFARESDDDGSVPPPRRPSGIWTNDRGASVAPEQRQVGTTIDTRADIWAIGALLRVLLAGAQRPGTLSEIADACGAEDPGARPQTIGEVAERIASFTTWPPHCFERLAERRQAAFDATSARARREAMDGLTALERLEERAIDRERESLRTPMPAVVSEQIRLERLVTTVCEQTGAPPPDVAPPNVLEIGEDDADVVIEDEGITVLTAPLMMAPSSAPASGPYVAALAPTSGPYVAALAPPSGNAPLGAPEPPRGQRDVETRSKAPWIVLGVGVVALAAAAVVGTMIYAKRSATAAIGDSRSIAAPLSGGAVTPATNANATATATAITPDSLPDVHFTPNALPDAPKAPALAPPRRAAPPAAAAPPATKPAAASSDDSFE